MLWEGFQKVLRPRTSTQQPLCGGRPIRAPRRRLHRAQRGHPRRLVPRPVLPPVQASAGEPGRTAAGRRSRQGEVAPERSAFGSTPARPRGEHKESFTLLGGFDPKASLPARSREWTFHGETSPLILPCEDVSARRGLQGGAQPSANISGARDVAGAGEPRCKPPAGRRAPAPQAGSILMQSRGGARASVPRERAGLPRGCCQRLWRLGGTELSG